MRRSFLAAAAAAIVLCVVACGGGSPIPARGSSEPGAKKKATDEVQKARKEKVDAYKALGFITRVEHDSPNSIRVEVTKAFLQNRPEDRAAVAWNIAYYLFAVPDDDTLGPIETVYFYDAGTTNIRATYRSSGYREE